MSIVGIWRAKNPSIKKVCKKIMRMISYISCRLDLSRRCSWVSKNISRFRSSKEFKKVPKWVRRWIFFRMLLLQHKWNSCYSFTATWPLILGIKMRPIMYRNGVKKPFPQNTFLKVMFEVSQLTVHWTIVYHLSPSWFNGQVVFTCNWNRDRHDQIRPNSST